VRGRQHGGRGAFGGPAKKTLYGVTIRDVQVMSIQMIAQGYKKRPK
jgi:hypothetical protein